jgi:hypothetical protein
MGIKEKCPASLKKGAQVSPPTKTKVAKEITKLIEPF